MKEIILGIGNTLKGDDGIGIYIAESINKYLQECEERSKKSRFTGARRELIAINCGTTPENYTSIIRKYNPDRLILVDAADMGLSPGSCRIIPPERIEVMHLSTHNMPLSFFISYVSEFCRYIVLIGVQSEKMDFGTGLSSAVKRSEEYVAKLIIKERLSEIATLKMRAT
ncbi:MAG: hydrogenase maturation peptidase HycI [Dehalococcoidia bacterium]|nr:hydrogenase maturation peptidase HycI [Dehalococcoidia bacterium]